MTQEIRGYGARLPPEHYREKDLIETEIGQQVFAEKVDLQSAFFRAIVDDANLTRLPPLSAASGSAQAGARLASTDIRRILNVEGDRQACTTRLRGEVRQTCNQEELFCCGQPRPHCFSACWWALSAREANPRCSGPEALPAL